jgi:Ca2+-binding RTX toxin-like protein
MSSHLQNSRRLGRAAFIAGLAAAGIAAVPGAASAAEIGINNGALNYRAEPGEVNNAKISFESNLIVVRETAATIDEAGVCSFDATRAAFVCPRNGVVRLNASLGDRGDRLEVDPVGLFQNVASNVDAGDGNDVVTIGEGQLPQSPQLAARRPSLGNLSAINLTQFRTRLSGIVLQAPGSTIVGGSGNDTITGGAGGDTITAGAGDDVVTARAGADNIDAGVGVDRVDAGVGDDDVTGGPGNDTINGGDGNDALTDRLIAPSPIDALREAQTINTIEGDGGSDLITTGLGQDTLRGEDGNDALRAGGGRDTLRGGAGLDFLLGQDGSDNLLGGDGADTVRGGDGNDRLGSQTVVDAGIDVYSGGAGDDVLISRDAQAVESPICGDGQDEVSVESNDSPSATCEIQRIFS